MNVALFRFVVTLSTVLIGLASLSCRSIPTSATGSVDTHQQIIGQDGAPMLLIPAGQFLMGMDPGCCKPGCCDEGTTGEIPARRVYVDAFYMDKYELTAKRYAEFMQATNRSAPDDWDAVNLARDGNRPVIGVDWEDASAYCRHYGKRLPTEQEWEKASRGPDGRKYPWGNKKPTRSLASYNWDDKRDWQGYSTLSAVGSYESGKSPYGLYDLSGNVWEWTSTDQGVHKVLRGGSWLDDAEGIRSSYRFWLPPMRRHNSFGFRCAQEVPK